MYHNLVNSESEKKKTQYNKQHESKNTLQTKAEL